MFKISLILLENRELKKKYPILQKNGTLKVHNVLGQPCILSHKARRTAQYRDINEDIYCKLSSILNK